MPVKLNSCPKPVSMVAEQELEPEARLLEGACGDYAKLTLCIVVWRRVGKRRLARSGGGGCCGQQLLRINDVCEFPVIVFLNCVK